MPVETPTRGRPPLGGGRRWVHPPLKWPVSLPSAVFEGDRPIGGAAWTPRSAIPVPGPCRSTRPTGATWPRGVASTWVHRGAPARRRARVGRLPDGSAPALSGATVTAPGVHHVAVVGVVPYERGHERAPGHDGQAGGPGGVEGVSDEAGGDPVAGVGRVDLGVGEDDAVGLLSYSATPASAPLTRASNRDRSTSSTTSTAGLADRRHTGVGAAIRSRVVATSPNRGLSTCQSAIARSTSSASGPTKFHHMKSSSSKGRPPRSSALVPAGLHHDAASARTEARATRRRGVDVPVDRRSLRRARRSRARSRVERSGRPGRPGRGRRRRGACRSRPGRRGRRARPPARWRCRWPGAPTAARRGGRTPAGPRRVASGCATHSCTPWRCPTPCRGRPRRGPRRCRRSSD